MRRSSLSFMVHGILPRWSPSLGQRDKRCLSRRVKRLDKGTCVEQYRVHAPVGGVAVEPCGRKTVVLILTLREC